MLTVVLLPVGIVWMIASSVFNKRDSLIREEAEAHRKILESSYDRIWSIVKQRAELTESERRSFNGIYPELIDRYTNDEVVLNWIFDCNIDFDPDDYVSLKEDIEDECNRFYMHQERMMKVIENHRQLLTTWPGKWFVKNKQAINYTPVAVDHNRWSTGL
ncbi:MAG: hypothetical protein IJ789_04900 [Bacteroidales bacterium]|nr:hypothetical protein [Bacteroidales bacterium]